MLRLLAQREQGYEDIAALMGLSVEQVRAKVKDALEEIDSDKAPPVPPPTPTPKVAKPAEVQPPAPPMSKVPLPADRRRPIEWLAGAAIVVLIVLFATGVLDIGGGGSDSSTTNAGNAPARGTNTAAANTSQATKAVLTPVNGGNAKGLALFGRVKKTAVLQVEATGLDPSPKGQSYTIWLYRSPKIVLRVGAVAVGKSGGIAAQFPIPAQVLAYVAGGAFDQIDISLTPNAAYDAEVAQAKKQKRLPAYTGTDILRGKITGPVVKK
jgi:Anti-sigma-K factor rskA.